MGFYIYSWQFRAAGTSMLEFGGQAKCSYKSESLEREAVRFMRWLQDTAKKRKSDGFLGFTLMTF